MLAVSSIYLFKERQPMSNSKMKIKVRLVHNVDDLIVGKIFNFIDLHHRRISSLLVSSPRDNTQNNQSGAETEERM